MARYTATVLGREQKIDVFVFVMNADRNYKVRY